ncbi:hypothetical protein ATO6_21365 [Oceanicola sp. 22II-s10i]|uniref:aminotransferase-like domain-containing protein n=1 Tax=Oceanicola sp. 22II-s10i TaxID=1317116 RepID=UPI000B527AFD|nr:PLP-dependent aminotransferase family protein [Oceanicola sp. 22II-s10i]OWU82995.1 hypothetical protein ATO6_21365 [Oceanicola sp. 22II-s10i]
MPDRRKRYQEVADIIRNWIASGSIRPGERLRSIREMARQTGYSIVTVNHAYALLEAEGAITARPRSGYFVADTAPGMGEFPAPSPSHAPAEGSDLSGRLEDWLAAQHVSVRRIIRAHLPMPTRGLVPLLMKAHRNEVLDEDRAPDPGGMPRLREAVAARNILRGVRTRPEHVVIAPNAMAAMSTCIDTICKPGSKVLVEVPGYFPALPVLYRRGITTIELPSHPRTGLDVAAFEQVLKTTQVDACLLMPNCHYPTGVTYSEEVQARIVAIATKYGVPIIENDIFGELGHDAAPVPSLRRFDAQDLVMQFGSFGPTLGATYGVGWIVNPRFRQEMIVSRLFYEERAGSVPIQAAVADFVLGPGYDRLLRRYRETLGHNVRRGIVELAQVLPHSAAVSRPDGGHTCWIRCPPGCDAIAIARAVGEQGPLLVPGQVFSASQELGNFFSLDLSAAGSDEFSRLLPYLASAIEQNTGAG